MIKFFRKIRQRLLSEGKTVRYLKYAIGEILLVVIGILIALSVNNWNENRKERIIEQKVLRTLKSDFKSNRDQLEDNIKETEELINSLSQILKLFRKSQYELNLLSKDSIIVGPSGYATFNPSDGALTNLFMSGDIGIIKNDSLKSRLTNWPNLVIDSKEDEDVLVEIITKELVFQQQKYLSFMINKKFNLNSMAMFDDLILQNTYARVLSGAQYQLDLYKELTKNIDEILILIEREIK